MSHYTVAVIHDAHQDIADMLAPFNENIRVEPYIRRTRTRIIQDAKNTKERFLSNLDEIKGNNEGEIPGYVSKYLNASTDEEFYKAGIYEDEDIYDEDGNELSTYNPNSKWDWYVVGGRWAGMLKKKHPADEDDDIDSVKIKDIDFSPDEEEYERHIRFWEVFVEGDTIRPGEDRNNFVSMYKKEYYLNRFKTKEYYAKSNTDFYTFAVITPDGVWHEPGQMGWFGISSESDEEWNEWTDNYMERFINHEDPERYITLVDCHI